MEVQTTNKIKCDELPVIHALTYEKKVDIWLDSKVNDKYIGAIDEEIDGSGIYYRCGERDMEEFFYYYTGLNDEDITATNKLWDKLEPTDYLESFIESYIKIVDENEIDGWNSVKKKDHDMIDDSIDNKCLKEFPEQIDILIPPHTNRHHANYLFKRLVDYCITHDLFFNIFNTKTGKVTRVPLIHPKFKREFYRFCYGNTTKSKKI
jgi:hypothetical protein